jgi:hypothetical protein
MTGHDGGMTSRPEHICRLPRRAIRGTVYECWCRRIWVAVDSVTVRGGRISALQPDWRPTAVRSGV